MESFETALTEATNPATRDLLGAIGLVVDGSGKHLYNHAAGQRSLASYASSPDLDSIVTLGSAGKFITHIAALQFIDSGKLTLDEPLSKWVPELDRLQVIEADDVEAGFKLRPAKDKITLRHLLTHTSGISGGDSALVEKWEASPAAAAQTVDPKAHPIVQRFSQPLLFDPGAGYCYGNSVVWTVLLISRLSDGQSLSDCLKEHVFAPLEMDASSFAPQAHPERLLQMVRRTDAGLVAVEPSPDMACSMRDLGKLFADLLKPAPTILRPETVDLLFAPQFAPGDQPLKDLRGDTENYAAPAGVLPGSAPEVNWTLAGLLVEGDMALPLSGMPPGTVTWNGMPNIAWAMNRERGVGMLFATQLVPVDDDKAVAVMMKFFLGAWETFGNGKSAEI
ncbi:beta-lactamase family protein [Mycena maculata]|uniref:Beta-lactamase family protein n=1 Tax=Mycena maculata TaxID=230809 RepID=A0AAD7NL63_9AGAR|nr:beta-lactamase family protein [Mycena maculata]